MVKKVVLVVTAIWAILAVVFAFTDLQISTAFFDPESRWALFLEKWGGYPGVIAYLSAFCILVFDRFRPFNETFKFSRRVVLFAKVTLGIAIVNVGIFVTLTKNLWGRVRFYNLDSSFSQFTAWYLPQCPNGHESFASGHTAEGWLLLPVGLILFSGRSRATRMTTTALAIGWGLAVAISRVRLGAHYASDVLFSSGVGITAFLLLYQYFSSRAIMDGVEKHPPEVTAPKKRAGRRSA